MKLFPDDIIVFSIFWYLIKNQDLLCDQSNVALTLLSWRAFPSLLWQTNQNQWDERWSLQIKELLLQQCNIPVFKCSVSDGYPLKLQYVDLVILFFRMTVTHVRSSSIGKCQQAAIFLLLFLTHPSLPRQVTAHQCHHQHHFLGAGLFSKCWLRLPQSLGLRCTRPRLPSYGERGTIVIPWWWWWWWLWWWWWW